MSLHDDAIIIAPAAGDMIKHAESAANNQDADTLCCWESERIGGHERVIQVRNQPEGDDETIIAVPTEAGVAAHIAGWQLSISPAQLYEYYRLQILAANNNNVPKLERAVAGVAKARAQGDLDAARCDELDRLMTRKRREMAADGGDGQ